MLRSCNSVMAFHLFGDISAPNVTHDGQRGQMESMPCGAAYWVIKQFPRPHDDVNSCDWAGKLRWLLKVGAMFLEHREGFCAKLARMALSSSDERRSFRLSYV